MEKKKIININELERDPDQMDALIKNMMKLDLAKFSQSREKSLSTDSTSCKGNMFNNSRSSVNSNGSNYKTNRRQGTPVSH